MDFQEFTGQVQHRIEAGTQGRAVRASRAVLTTLGERLEEGSATDVASPLPMEIDRYVVDVDGHAQRFDYDEFLDRVVAKANNEDVPGGLGDAGEMDHPDADFATKAILDLVVEQLPGSQATQLRDQLPEEYDDAFAFVDAEQTPWEASE